jgi:pilus assembly protein Flp/PilA
MISHLKHREDGQGLVEYALILLLIALAVLGSLTVFGGSLNTYYQGIVTAF